MLIYLGEYYDELAAKVRGAANILQEDSGREVGNFRKPRSGEPLLSITTTANSYRYMYSSKTAREPNRKPMPMNYKLSDILKSSQSSQFNQANITQGRNYKVYTLL